MESVIPLALAERIKQIFKSDSSEFLTFPHSLWLPCESFSFMKAPQAGGLTPQQRLNYRGEFALSTNIIPKDSIELTYDSSGNLLWDQITSILKQAIFAKCEYNEKEWKELEEADAFVSVEINEQGQRKIVPSEASKKYYEYRDLYWTAVENFRSEQIDVENSYGPEAAKVQQHWNSYRKAELERAIKQAEINWIELGYKNQFARYISVIEDLKVKNSQGLFGQEYLTDIEQSTNRELREFNFCPTFFRPADAFELTTPWTKLTISRPEIEKFIDKEDSAVLGASMEYKDVAIVRPWYKEELFSSRFWKLPEGSQVVSDGQIPRSGQIPAIITRLIAARNVKVTRKKRLNSLSPLQVLRQPLKQKSLIHMRS